MTTEEFIDNIYKCYFCIKCCIFYLCRMLIIATQNLYIKLKVLLFIYFIMYFNLKIIAIICLLIFICAFSILLSLMRFLSIFYVTKHYAILYCNSYNH